MPSIAGGGVINLGLYIPELGAEVDVNLLSHTIIIQLSPESATAMRSEPSYQILKSKTISRPSKFTHTKVFRPAQNSSACQLARRMR